MKYYDYFVSHHYQEKRGHGEGMCHVYMTAPVDNFRQVEKMANLVKESNDFETVVIVNFILLREVDGAEIEGER